MMKNLSNIVSSLLVKESSRIEVKYICKTTSTNGEYIIVKIGDEEYKRYESSEPKGFAEELESAVKTLNARFPDLHVISKKVELHFLYSGFNSVERIILPVVISNLDPKTEVRKTGKITESFHQIGKTKAQSIINAHPDYEIYLRHGFSFRGSQEQLIEKGRMNFLEQELSFMCCCDIDIQDNEIHINTFSYNDMM